MNVASGFSAAKASSGVEGLVLRTQLDRIRDGGGSNAVWQPVLVGPPVGLQLLGNRQRRGFDFLHVAVGRVRGRLRDDGLPGLLHMVPACCDSAHRPSNGSGKQQR